MTKERPGSHHSGILHTENIENGVILKMQLAHKFTEKHGSASSPAREGCILFFFSSSFTLEQTRFCADSQLIRGPFHCSSAYHIDFFTLALVQVARNARWGFIFPSYWRACPVRKKKRSRKFNYTRGSRVDHTGIIRGSLVDHSCLASFVAIRKTLSVA